MSQQLSVPSLDQYPGYFPAAKPPFWTRLKTALVAGLLGLLIGGAMAAPGSADSTKPAADHPTTQIQPPAADVDAQIQQAVDQATSDMQGQLDRERELSKARVARVQARAHGAQVRAVRQAVTKARSEERAKTAAAVAQARQAAQSQVRTFAGSGGGTDPRFSYCYEANAAGYGPYHRGETEYGWYDDADNDGTVCE